MDFEFGNTKQVNRFFDRNPKFYPAFERLMALANKCLGREPHAKCRAEDICFELGHTCRADYTEVLFLAVNGFGSAASKLLRGLYERTVTLAYIVKHPEKAERFVRYAAVQEKKLLDRALVIVTEEQIDDAVGPASAARIRERYEEIKPEFQTTICKKCHNRGTSMSWDMDVSSMVRDVGAPYDAYYVGCYAIPNLQLHATLASVAHESDEVKKLELSERQSHFALMNATAVLILAVRSQNAVFKLEMDDEIEMCERDFLDVFGAS